MKNKTIANGLIVFMGISFLGGFVGAEEEGFFLLMGVGMMVFGIFAIIRLYKLED